MKKETISFKVSQDLLASLKLSMTPVPYASENG